MLKGTVLVQRRILTVCTLAAFAIGGSTALAADPLAVFGTDGNDTMTGTPAAESFYARGGNDKVSAAGGDDELDGGAGADVLNGGDGTDVVSYAGAAPVIVSLDGTADDGAAGEGDNVATDVEDVISGDGADKLTGSDAANMLDGGAGDDRIDGGAGSDSLFGGAGDDTISARDGQADSIDCGDGTDTAIVDRVDVAAGCEKTERPPVTTSFSFSIKPVPGANGVPRVKLVTLTGVAQGSTVVVACSTGCGSAPRTLVRRDAVGIKRGKAVLKLPSSPGVVSGATIEVGVTAPGANRRCVRFALARKLLSVKRLQRACTSAAAVE